MKAILRDAMVYCNGGFETRSMVLDDAALSAFTGEVFPHDVPVFNNTVIFPGFCDVHVHLREPGFSYKETIATGTLASARGGYTAVCSMPNLNPAPDTPEHLKIQTDIIERDAVIAVYPYATITKCQAGLELSDMDGLAKDAIAFSDDGRGVQDEEMMRRAMEKAKSLGKMIVAHCEDNSLLFGGYIHDGEYAKAHGHRGISSESEWVQIKRDLKLAERTGCPYHVCHISTKESVALIRKAKARGVDVTCETAPHYLTLDESALSENARFKMNPPLRGKDDREALIEGIIDGTIDMIATDHAPHGKEEKALGLEKSPMGVVGIETALPVLWTELVMKGVITPKRLVELLSLSPRARFGIKSDPGFTVFSMDKPYRIDTDEFLSKGRSTPYEGTEVYGRPLVTVYNGRVVYSDKALKG